MFLKKRYDAINRSLASFQVIQPANNFRKCPYKTVSAARFQQLSFHLLPKRHGYFWVIFFYLDHFCHVALGPCVFCGIFHFNQHYEVQVVPHVVLLFDVLFKRHCLVVKLVTLQTCSAEGTGLAVVCGLKIQKEKQTKLTAADGFLFTTFVLQSQS